MKKGSFEWKPFTVIRSDHHKVAVRSAARGPETHLALEDVRLRPRTPLARQISNAEAGIHEKPVLSQNASVPDDSSYIEEDEQESDWEDEDDVPLISLRISSGDRASPTEEHESQEQAVETPGDAQQKYGEQSPELSGQQPEETAPSEKQERREPQDKPEAQEAQPTRRSSRIRRPPNKLSLHARKSPFSLDGALLPSMREAATAKAYEANGYDQFVKGKGKGVPDWLYETSLADELDNWKGHYQSWRITDIPPGANIVGSHVVYRAKKEDDGTLRFKARLVVHGNEDALKNAIRKDSATAQLATIRTILSMAVCYRLRLAKADIKAAYFQSGPIKRTIFMRPPKEMLLFKTVWKLLSLPYGVGEAGRQWQLTSDDFLIDLGLEQVYALPQCFIKRCGGKLVLIVGKVVDDFLVAGTPTEIDWILCKIRARSTVGSEASAPQLIRFNGATIEQARDFSIRLSMEEFKRSINPLNITRERRKQAEQHTTAAEKTDFLSLAGKMNWLGHTAAPQYAFAASYLQQHTDDLRVRHLAMANGLLRELKHVVPIIVFGRPSGPTLAKLNVFADAAFPKAAGGTQPQTGIIQGLTLGDGPTAAFHALDWTSHRQNRVCRSAAAAEIMSIAEAEERASGFCIALRRVTNLPIQMELNVDSRSLYDTITTQRESDNFRVRQAVQALRESFEAGEIDTMRWISGKSNPADTLTKRSSSTSRLLNEMMRTGRLQLDFDDGLATRGSD